jgi:hypothetical protein
MTRWSLPVNTRNTIQTARVRPRHDQYVQLLKAIPHCENAFLFRHDESVCTSDGPVNAGDTLLTQPFMFLVMWGFGLALPWRFAPMFHQFHSPNPLLFLHYAQFLASISFCTNAWFLDLGPPQTGYGFCCRTRALDALQRDGEDVLSMFIVARPFGLLLQFLFESFLWLPICILG